MQKILVVGDIYSETQYFTDSIPLENEFAFAREVVSTVGSKSINVARTLAKLGDDVTYFGIIGEDVEGREAESQLRKHGIEPQLTKNHITLTGKIAVITPKSGKSSIVLSAGANELLTPEMVLELGPKLHDFDCVYTSTALPLESLYAFVDLCHKLKLPIFLDIPNQQSSLDLTRVANVNFFMPNRQEAALLVGNPINTLDDARTATVALRKPIQGTIIVTLDKDGCIVLESGKNEPQHFSTQSVNAVDETGAGDIFRGSFLSKWLETKNITTSIKYGLEKATSSVTIMGVNSSIENITK